MDLSKAYARQDLGSSVTGGFRVSLLACRDFERSTMVWNSSSPELTSRSW
uniref:Uncharacterized protein n=1 Tax=Manihot esculenta TaxID=3983 RepID=A0A2C9UM02_MANES